MRNTTKQPEPILIKLYADPGHAWGCVKRKLLEDLCIADQISPYSYQKGASVYLEEDRDLWLFTNALVNRGIAYDYKQKHTDNKSPIRSYERYTAKCIR